MNKTGLRILIIIGLLAGIGALVGVKASQFGAMMKAGKAFVPPPESVTSAKVETQDWQASQSAIGSLVAIRGVTLGAELGGVIRDIGFESGTNVRRGQLLVKLDTSNEEAQLASAQADAQLAHANLERAVKLRAGGANAPADLDSASARAKQADAAVQALQATIAKKIIRAPFDGRVAIRQVELGQSVSPGTPLASLQSVSPIYAEFALPQQALGEISLKQQVVVRTDTFPDDSWSGTVSTINPEVDVATRTVKIRATVPNGDGRLRPGMFVNVQVKIPGKRPVLVVPATAVLYAPYGDSIFVLENQTDGSGKTVTTVHQKFVRTGEHRGDLVAVLSGLSAGERVVSSGAFKLRNGMTVVTENALSPKTEIAPQPTDK
jgi:membrane fusion protein (multidrug efflux system)